MQFEIKVLLHFNWANFLVPDVKNNFKRPNKKI